MIGLSKDNQHCNGPLRGVIACVTGLNSREKDEIHHIIQELGGRFTRDLAIKTNTHLIAVSATGPKFEAASRFLNCIQIVTPAWVKACYTQQSHVNETNFELISKPQTTVKEVHAPTPAPVHAPAIVPALAPATIPDANHRPRPTLLDLVRQGLEIVDSTNTSYLFWNLTFFIVDLTQEETSKGLKDSLGRMIRHGLGTVLYRMNLMVTHIIVLADCPLEIEIEKSIRVLTEYHPNAPEIYTPHWLVSCMEQQKILQARHFALLIEEVKPKSQMRPGLVNVRDNIQFSNLHPTQINDNPSTPLVKTKKKENYSYQNFMKENQDQTSNIVNSTTSDPSNKYGTSSDGEENNIHNESRADMQEAMRKSRILKSPKRRSPSKYSSPAKLHHTGYFNGHVFTCLDLTDKNNSKAEIERFVIKSGGVMLTKGAIEMANTSKPMICHVVVLGALPVPQNIPLDEIPPFQGRLTLDHVKSLKNSPPSPLLDLIQAFENDSRVYQIIPVTTVWLETCARERKYFSPENISQLFQPQYSYLRNSGMSNLYVAVTGFVAEERTGIAQYLKHLGATYTETLKRKNTHLICKEATGAKYHRAVEWNLHVVSLEWLFYVGRYGVQVAHGKESIFHPRSGERIDFSEVCDEVPVEPHAPNASTLEKSTMDQEPIQDYVPHERETHKCDDDISSVKHEHLQNDISMCHEDHIVLNKLIPDEHPPAVSSENLSPNQEVDTTIKLHALPESKKFTNLESPNTLKLSETLGKLEAEDGVKSLRRQSSTRGRRRTRRSLSIAPLEELGQETNTPPPDKNLSTPTSVGKRARKFNENNSHQVAESQVVWFAETK